jgi:hypothetical protein
MMVSITLNHFVTLTLAGVLCSYVLRMPRLSTITPPALLCHHAL